jgi:hypothetical protein
LAERAEWVRAVKSVRNGLPLKHPAALEDFDEILRKMGVSDAESVRGTCLYCEDTAEARYPVCYKHRQLGVSDAK